MSAGREGEPLRILRRGSDRLLLLLPQLQISPILSRCFLVRRIRLD